MNEKGCEFTLIERKSDEILIDIVFDKTYKYFDGHFEDFQLLPALLQVHTVVELTKKYFDESKSLKSIPNMKFTKPIYPNSKVKLSISKQENKYQFKYFKDEFIYSQGSFRV